jgi:nitrite reductase (NADH) large subunit
VNRKGIKHMTEKLVIIGNGMATGRMLEHLLDREPSRYQTTIFNAEPHVNYDRIMLSPVLSGEKDYDEIIIHDDAWYIKNSISLYKGRKIVAIDRMAKTVVSYNGALEAYDKLVIATGSIPLIIPVPGHDLPGVLTYRDLDDVNAMLIAAQSRDKAVVIGGGLLGLEAAAGLAARGMDVTVLHLMPTLMERQLDAAAGYLLKRALEDRGVKVVTKANTRAILGKDGVEGVRLADGTIIPATLVVMASGIRPSAGLARDAGLEVNRGILVDAGMRTSDADILAIGECAEVGGHVYGLVAPLYEMARVAAAQLCGDGAASFIHNDTPTKLKVTGIELFSLGDSVDDDDRQEIVLRDAAAGVYKRLTIKNNRIIGAVLFGDTSDGAWFNELRNKEVDISDMRDTLIFGEAYHGGTPLDPMAAVAALPDDGESAAATASAEARSSAPTSQRRLGSRSLCFGPRKTYSSPLRTVVRSRGTVQPVKRAWRGRYPPAAQLVHFARDRQGAWRR